MQERMFFYMGAVSTVDEITDEAIKQAHMSMVFPWSRAIISSCLGYDLVTNLGVPESYGAQ